MYTPKPPPEFPLELQGLVRWMEEELQALSRDAQETQTLELRPSAAEPQNPREGMIVYADGTNWDPGDGAGSYQYVGGVWVLQRSGAEPNSYGTITDGTTPAPANSAGATFKLRAGTGLAIATQNDDGTHGDNALYSLVLKDLASVAPVLGDKLPFMDVSNSDANARTTIQILLDLIGSLATVTPVPASDYLPFFDQSGSVAGKALMSDIARGETLISTTNLNSGTSVDIAIPSGYKSVELRLYNWTKANNTIVDLRLSEDAGSTFLNAAYALFNDASVVSATTADSSAAIISNSASNAVFTHVIRLRDYTGSRDKTLTFDAISMTIGVPFTGFYIFTSTAAVNLFRLQPQSGAFNGSGVAELWGTP